MLRSLSSLVFIALFLGTSSVVRAQSSQRSAAAAKEISFSAIYKFIGEQHDAVTFGETKNAEAL